MSVRPIMKDDRPAIMRILRETPEFSAIYNDHVDIIGHPTGRLLGKRMPYAVDVERIIDAAADTGTALEINASPYRLDLDDIYAKRAVEMGILLSINTDAHSAADLDMLHFGVATARRGWVKAQDVINTWKPEQLETWLKSRGNNKKKG